MRTISCAVSMTLPWAGRVPSADGARESAFVALSYETVSSDRWMRDTQHPVLWLAQCQHRIQQVRLMFAIHSLTERAR